MNTIRQQEELIDVELPAADFLESILGWQSLSAIEANRLREGNTSSAILELRLGEAIGRLNPWIDDTSTRRIITSLTRISGADLGEINETAHALLTYGATAAYTDEKGRRKDRNVRLFDFDDPENGNVFEFSRQFRVKGPRQEIIPDIVCHVNGIPLAVIECKAPSLVDPMEDAIDQFRRYEGRDEFSGLGAPRLFWTTQFCIALAKDDAKYGTVGTPDRFWSEWRTPYPGTRESLERKLGRTVTAQDVTLYSLLRKDNILDLVRNFIVFEIERGQRIKKLARYQQFIAVRETIKRFRTAERPDERGGVIHHTQGSGKSLTMVFLASVLRRLAETENPSIVIVTDRTDLDDQISGTFRRAGFANPVQAGSGAHLRSLLASGAGPTVLSTVHKFHTAVPSKSSVISNADNIFVLIDEAHRTQYGALAARMRAGLPNACLIAFTGTPIDKGDRSTKRVFGDYIHRYQIDEAVRDGATVPIYYEMRDARMRVEGGGDLQAKLRELLPDKSDEEIQKTIKRVGLAKTIAGSKVRIAMIAQDILSHFRETIEPNGFKAQLVATSRRNATKYKEKLDELGAPESAVIMSTSAGDTALLQRHHHSKRERDAIIERFKDKSDPLKILVVCDMLLTGFDAPIEQVMYLDAPLREHTLLQAIARVNRTAVSKTHGLVVDYWGDSERIAEALSMFNQVDVEGALLTKDERYKLLEHRHRAVIRYFDGIDRLDNEACLRILGSQEALEPGEVPVALKAFDLALQRFGQAMDMVLPDPKALEEPFQDDLRWLIALRNKAHRTIVRDTSKLNAKLGAKVRQLIEEAIDVGEIERMTVATSIHSADFKRHLEALISDDARASEMEHAIRHEIHVQTEQNPSAMQSLWERLEQLINERREQKVSAASALEKLHDIADKVAAASQGVSQSGLTGDAGAIFAQLETTTNDLVKRKELAIKVASAIEQYSSVVDWFQKEDVKRHMRRAIKTELRSADIPIALQAQVTSQVVDLIRARTASRL